MLHKLAERPLILYFRKVSPHCPLKGDKYSISVFLSSSLSSSQFFTELM